VWSFLQEIVHACSRAAQDLAVSESSTGPQIERPPPVVSNTLPARHPARGTLLANLTSLNFVPDQRLAWSKLRFSHPLFSDP
jgi:hypothetical protein